MIKGIRAAIESATGTHPQETTTPLVAGLLFQLADVGTPYGAHLRDQQLNKETTTGLIKETSPSLTSLSRAPQFQLTPGSLIRKQNLMRCLGFRIQANMEEHTYRQAHDESAQLPSQKDTRLEFAFLSALDTDQIRVVTGQRLVITLVLQISSNFSFVGPMLR